MLIACFFLLGAFLLTLQTSLFTLLPDWVGNPDLLFILIIFLAVRMDTYRGAVLTLLLGLLMDIFSGLFLGLYPTVFLVLFFVIKGVGRNIVITEPAHQVPVVVIGYILNSVFIYIFSSLLATDTPLIWSWRDLLLQLLILAMLAMPFFQLYDLLMTIINQRTGKKQSLLRSRKTGNRFIS